MSKCNPCVWLLLSTAISFGFSGCATISTASLGLGVPEPEAPEPALTESPQAMLYKALQTARTSNAIVLQVEGTEKPFRIIPLPTDDKTVFMNDLLRQAGLLKRVSSLDVTLFRNAGGIGDGVKMAVTIDRKTRRVAAGTDYALRPGDRIAVRRKAPSVVTSMVDAVIPPIARTVFR